MTRTDEFALFVAVLAECAHKYPPTKGPFGPNEIVGLAGAFRKAARTLERLAVAECNRELTEKEERRRAATVSIARDVAKTRFGANVIVAGDPRGYALKLDLPTGRYNTMGGAEEGYGVPT